MKRFFILPAAFALCLPACDTMNSPVSSGSFDPLAAPGSQNGPRTVEVEAFKAGEFAVASMDNTAFFNNRPEGNASADKLLSRGTSMKVISMKGSYAKVELDNGNVGYVPTVMMNNPNAAGAAGGPVPVINPGEYQVYPPVGGAFGAPIDPVDPAELPPGGAIPTVIDPEAPAVPMPEGSPVPESGPAPLPPNQDDLKAMEEANAADPVVPKLEE